MSSEDFPHTSDAAAAADPAGGASCATAAVLASPVTANSTVAATKRPGRLSIKLTSPPASASYSGPSGRESSHWMWTVLSAGPHVPFEVLVGLRPEPESLGISILTPIFSAI